MNQEDLKIFIARYEAVTFSVNRRLNAMIRDLMPEELTVDQFATLRYLRSRERCTSSELADSFCVGKSSITAIVTRLSDKNLIKRMPDEKDRRVIYLALTEEGIILSDRIEERMNQLLSKYVSHFNEQEAFQFIETFEKLGKLMVDS